MRAWWIAAAGAVAAGIACHVACTAFSSEGDPPSDAGPNESSPEDGGAKLPDAGSAYAAAVRADRPIAFWRLGEAQNATMAQDEVGNHDATYLKGTRLGVEGSIDGDNNTAMHLDGTFGGLAVDGGFDFPNKSAFTIEMWVRPERFDTTYRPLVRRVLIDGGGEYGYGLTAYSTLGIFAGRFVGTGLDVRAGDAGPQAGGPWRHVAAVYDGTTIALFVDAERVAATADGRAMPSVSATLFIGCRDGVDTFVGDIDDVAIYGKALSGAQLAKHVDAARRPK